MKYRSTIKSSRKSTISSSRSAHKRLESGLLNPVVLSTETDALVYQVPGGMLSNLVAQLTAQKSLDKLDEVLAEVPRVRKDLGYPPLVTPMSQMVGVQATANVLAGERYKKCIQRDQGLSAR